MQASCEKRIPDQCVEVDDNNRNMIGNDYDPIYDVPQNYQPMSHISPSCDANDHDNSNSTSTC